MDRRGRGCQLSIVEQVCSAAKNKGLACHGLGLVLDPMPMHVKRAVEMGLSSFDSTSWTHPNKRVVEKLLGIGIDRLKQGIVSARTLSEKELFLWLEIKQLMKAGVELELASDSRVSLLSA